MSPQVEHRDDGTVIFAPNGDPILKLCVDACLLHSFGAHPLDSRAASLSSDALEALRDWSTRELAAAPAHTEDKGEGRGC